MSSQAQLAMNPCLRKACSPKLDFSSAMPVSTVAFWRCWHSSSVAEVVWSLVTKIQ